MSPRRIETGSVFFRVVLWGLNAVPGIYWAFNQYLWTVNNRVRGRLNGESIDSSGDIRRVQSKK